MNENDSGIVRTPKNRQNPYKAMNIEAFNDNRLTWEARGVLAYLLSKPDDWQVRLADLQKKAPGCGRDKMKRILKELQDTGYLIRERIRVAHGRFQWVSTIYETPQNVVPHTENPSVDDTALQSQTSTTNGLAVDGRAVDGQGVDITNMESTNNKVVESATRSRRRSTKKQETEPTPLAIRQAMADVCKIGLSTGTKKQLASLNVTCAFLWQQAQKARVDAEGLADRIRFTGGKYWYANTWQGKKNERPQPHNIHEEWHAAMEQYNARKNGTATPKYYQPDADNRLSAEESAALLRAALNGGTK